MSREHPYKKFFVGAIIGSSLGAVSALMATGKTKGIKKEILKKYHMLKDELEHFSKDAFHMAQPKKMLKTAKKAVKKAAKKAVRRAIKKVAKKVARKSPKKVTKRARSRRA